MLRLTVLNIFFSNFNFDIPNFGPSHFVGDGHRKSTIWPGQRELRIFKLLVKYIRDPVSADYFLDILLPFLRKKDLNSGKAI